MINLLQLLVFIFLSYTSIAQDTWTIFYDDEGYMRGFENVKGKVMIAPKFMGFTTANKFDDLVAVMQDSSGIIESYYLLKDGKRFGKDSMYVFDMAFDCEHEGFIKFREPNTELVGMFDKRGKVAIPAMYSDMTRFYNGLIVALQGARKEYWDKDSSHSGCNHWSWVGGKEVLIIVFFVSGFNCLFLFIIAHA